MGMVVKAQNPVSVRDVMPERAVSDSTSSGKDDFNKLLESKKEQLKIASGDGMKEPVRNVSAKTSEKTDKDTEITREEVVDSEEEVKQDTTPQQAGLEQSFAQMTIMVTEPEQEIFVGVFKAEAMTEQTVPVEVIQETKTETVQPDMAQTEPVKEGEQAVSFFEGKVPESVYQTTLPEKMQEMSEKPVVQPQIGVEKPNIQPKAERQTSPDMYHSGKTRPSEESVISEGKAGVAEIRETRTTDVAREPKTDEKQVDEKEILSDLMFRKVSRNGREEEPGPGAGGQGNQSQLTEPDKLRTRGFTDHEGEERTSIYGDSGFRLLGQHGEMPTIGYKAGEMPLKTTPQTLPEDLGKALASRMPENGKTLTVELEPAALGKLTIKMIYEGGRAAVSIMASNPKTLELLNQRASEIAAILEEKTGQQTVIYTHESQQGSEEQLNQEHHSRQDREAEEERRQKQDEKGSFSESFVQQLRLGLV